MLPKLLPSPQVIRSNNSAGKLNLIAIRGFVLGKGCVRAKSGVGQVNTRLNELSQKSLPYIRSGKPGQSGTVWLGLHPDSAAEKLVVGLPEPKEQGYRLVVGEDSIVILGKDLPGLYYGLMTLRQLVEADGSIPRVSISDWPDLKLRGTYTCEGDPEKKIEYFASLKLNFIVFETGEFYYMDKPASRKRWQKIFDTCRRNFIEPIPELQSFGHGNVNIDIEPRCVEGVYMKNVPATVQNGEIIVHRSKEPVSDTSIVNAGFEQKNGIPDGWLVDTKNGEIAVTDIEKHSGNSSLCISHQSLGTLRAWQMLPCLEQSNYKYTCYIKTKDVAKGSGISSGAYTEIYGVTENGELSPGLLTISKIQNGTNDWSQLSLVFNTQQYKKLCIFVRLQDTSGTAWFDDLELKCLEKWNQLSPNITITPTSPLIMTNKAGDIKYKEGKDYQIIPGDPLVIGDNKTGKKFYPMEGKPATLKIISTGQITDGDELLLSYNYAPAGSVSCCPSEPLYRNMMQKAIYKVVKTLKCKYLHIGHDEPQALNRDSRCKERGLSNVDLYVDEIMRMRQYAIDADPKCKTMMWDDSLNPYSNAAGFKLESAAQFVPKDIIMNVWAYSYPGDSEKIQKSIKFWTDLGFDITGSPWYDVYNAHYWDQALKEHKNSRHILGSFYTAWGDDPPHMWFGLTTSAQYAWSNTIPLDEFLATKDK